MAKVPCTWMSVRKLASHRCLARKLVTTASRPALSRQLACKASDNRRSISGDKYDVVLSSGFLAFALHSGFLQAVEDAGVEVAGIMGTSAGALAGSLYCAGYSPQQVAEELSRDPPISLLRVSSAPWRGGMLSLEGVVARLRDLLPPRFEDLPVDFAVGVVNDLGVHELIDSGPLPEAVAASAAIPIVFESVDIPGRTRLNPYKDGGLVDRIGLTAWRQRRRSQALASGLSPARVPPALVHVIARSSPFSGFDDFKVLTEPYVHVVQSPKSHANFFSLGAFEQQMAASTRRAKPILAQAVSVSSSVSVAPSMATSTGGGGPFSAVCRDKRSPERPQRLVSSARG